MDCKENVINKQDLLKNGYKHICTQNSENKWNYGQNLVVIRTQ